MCLRILVNSISHSPTLSPTPSPSLSLSLSLYLYSYIYIYVHILAVKHPGRGIYEQGQVAELEAVMDSGTVVSAVP